MEKIMKEEDIEEEKKDMENSSFSAILSGEGESLAR